MVGSRKVRGIVTVAATLLMVVLTVMPVNTLAVFVRPVCAGIGISTGQFTVVFSLSAAGAMVTSFFFGRLIKVFGKKKLIIFGGITLSVFLFTLALTKNIYLIYISVFVSGFSACTTGFTMGQLIITEWFDQYRATMFSMLTVSLSLFAAIFSPVFAFCIEQFGYSAVLMTEGAVCGGLIIIGGLFFIGDSPETYGLKPFGYKEDAALKSTRSTTLLSTKRMRKTAPYWMIMIIGLAGAMVGRVATSHGNNFFQSLGLDSMQAAYVSSVNSIATLVWALLFGLMADKFSPKIAAVITGTLAAAVMLFNPFLHGLTGALIFAIFVEAESGISNVYSPAVATKIYGKDDAASLIGQIRCTSSIGAMIGPTLAGVMFDATGNYKSCLIIIGVMMLFVLTCVITIDCKRNMESVRKIKGDQLV